MRPTMILDTNVLIAGLRSSLGASFELLEMIGTDRFSIGLTVPLVLEYEMVCSRSLDALDLTSIELGQLLEYWCSVAILAPVWFHVRPESRDPSDDMILEAAIASASDWIVTHNVRDLASVSQRFGIETIVPREALRRLRSA